jgi:hypothetical protein
VKHLRQKLAFILGGLWLLGMLVGGATLLQAQEVVSDWATPENLSQSGGTTAPFMVMDEAGALHVFWQDAYAEIYVYRNNQLGIWSAPVTMTLPFTLTTPQLLADDNGRIHAFWQDTEEDNSPLLYSNVPITGVANSAAWSPVQLLADATADLDVALDDDGQLHTLYLRQTETGDMPAGIYHRRTAVDETGTQIWLPPELLYQTPYFRGLNGDDANVELATAVSEGRTWLFAAWDNRPRKQLLLARSGDGGANWEAPIEVAGPESGSSVISPFNLKVAVQGENVVLVWNKGEKSLICQQFYQSSPDLGTTWEERQLMPTLLPGTANCTKDNQFVVGSEFLFLLSALESQTFLWAWDGTQWSSPEPQEPLTRFDNPETLNAIVFRCQQPMGTEDNRLLVIGCEEDIRGFGDGDIWLQARPLGTADEWFPPPTLWSPISQVNSSPESYHSLAIVPSANGEFLAYWMMPKTTGNGLADIVNARLSDGRWLLPEVLFEGTSTLSASPITAVTSPSGQFYISWGDGLGKLYLAQAPLTHAHIASAWSELAEIPITGLARYPMLAVDDNNVLHLAYSVPINEERGVYLISSSDSGRTWSDPVTVFDATSAGWEAAGPSRLAVTGDGQVHVMWEQQSFLESNEPQTKALYYTLSEDGGLTFAPAEQVAEGLFSWSALQAAEDQTIHQFWQTNDGSTVILTHRYSTDGGMSWSQPQVVNGTPGQPTVAEGRDGVLHLLILGDTAVNEWRWQNEQWAQQETLMFDPTSEVDTSQSDIVAAIAPTGNLATLFSGQQTDAATGELLNNLYAANRLVDETAVSPPAATAPVGQPTTTATPTSQTNADSEATSTASPSPTIESTAVAEATAVPEPDINSIPPTTAGSPILNTVFSIIPSILLVMLIFGIGLRAIWLRRR